MPVLNLPAFRARTPFVCPIDNVNPNRVFPGDPHGSYSEQMTHALINEFVVHADAYVDLHGGDIPEALVPFVICRSEAGLADFKPRDVAARSKEIAMAFGLPYVLTVSKPVQSSKGQSSYAAAADKGIPAVLAEAGGIGQMQEGAVALLSRGVINVMRHLEMIESAVDVTAPANDEARMTNDRNKSEIKNSKDRRQQHGYNASREVRVALHEEHRRVVSESRAGRCRERRGTDRDGRRFVWRHSRRNCFAGERRCTFFDDQSIRARERVAYGNRSGIRSDQSV